MATNSAPERNHENEIWNPWAALWLSIIFTPVFGTMLQGTDLRHIGDKEGADAAFLWERFSMILLAIAAIIQPIAAIRPGWGLTLFIVDIVLLVGWAATCGFRHAIRIREAQNSPSASSASRPQKRLPSVFSVSPPGPRSSTSPRCSGS